MRHGLLYTLRIMSAVTVLCASTAGAVTTATGSYYANPSWDQKLQCDTQATCPRFIVLSNWSDVAHPAGGAAVLDRETGLVWEQSPDATTQLLVNAYTTCNNKEVGGRKGWKLPSIQELASLVDPTVPRFSGLHLPAGHPFANVQLSFYFSSTTSVVGSKDVWGVFFDDGNVQTFTTGIADVNKANVWCVRGGPGSDAQGQNF